MKEGNFIIFYSTFFICLKIEKYFRIYFKDIYLKKKENNFKEKQVQFSKDKEKNLHS